MYFFLPISVLGLTCEHFSSTACEKVAKDLRKSSPFCAVTKKLCKTNENKCFATFVVREDNSTTHEQESVSVLKSYEASLRVRGYQDKRNPVSTADTHFDPHVFISFRI